MGFELSKNYVQKVRTRLEAIKPGDALEGPENPLLSAPKTRDGKTLNGKVRKRKKAEDGNLFDEV